MTIDDFLLLLLRSLRANITRIHVDCLLVGPVLYSIAPAPIPLSHAHDLRSPPGTKVFNITALRH